MTTEGVTIGGVAIPPATPVTLCIGAANRDPDQFAEPERLDVARTPNRHLAFGFGVHHCVGMTLARLEGRVAIARFLQRFPDFRLDGAPVRGRRARFRGFITLPAATG
jgi:cytochrome P450